MRPLISRMSVLAACLSIFPILSALPALGERLEELEVRPGELLEVDVRTGGNVSIVGWDESRITVEADLGRIDRELVDLDLRRTEKGAALTTDYRGRYDQHGSPSRFEIRVPREFDLNVRTTGGSIRLDGIEGKLSGETLGGSLVLRNLRGELSLGTLGGNVELRDSVVGGRLQTHGGNVMLQGVEGNVETHTFGGNVIFENVRPGSGDTEVRATTQGGNIEVPEAPYGADLETLGGNITVERAGGHVRARSMGGNITIRATDGSVHAKTMGGDVTVVMVGDPGVGERGARLESMGGNVELRYPKGMSMDIDVTLAYTKRSTKNFDITSDVPLEIRRSDGWDYSVDPPRQYVYGRATVGGGGHRIKIETTNGDVRLVEQP